MANRTGTYFAFDGLGQTEPTKSDFRYYATVQAWNSSSNIEFKFVNSHEKAGAVRDTSKIETLKKSIKTRLSASKNMVVILSKDTRKSGSLLSWEIEMAIDNYELPLIIAYTDVQSVLDPEIHSNRWPSTLHSRINNGTAKAIHIPFRKDAILSAINQFSVSGEKLHSPLQYYTEKAQRDWGYLS